MKWEEYFRAVKNFLEVSLGKEIEIPSSFGKRVFRISDPDNTDDIIFILYNIKEGNCKVVRAGEVICLPVPIKDLKLFTGRPQEERKPERFIEDFLFILKIEKGGK